MDEQSDGPELSPWFWDLLESSSSSLCLLCRKLEQLPRELLRSYQEQYDEAKEHVNPHYCEEFWPYIVEAISEDHCDDFAAWVVMRGRHFYQQLRANPASLPRQLEVFDDVERRLEGSPRWDDEVDREEYEGYQRADYIAKRIYKLRFGVDLDDEPA
jgi:hypothetical protein